jgi:large subunit ribosomal protein L22
MDVTSTYKYARISARKARDVAREIQGLSASAAIDLLKFTPRKAAELFGKTVKTALADAENNFEIPTEGLYVKSAVVGDGPMFKRFKARARGSAATIRKRTAHLTVVLSDDLSGKEIEPRSAKAAAASKKAEPAAKSEAKAPDKAKKASAKSGKVDGLLGVVYDSAPPEVDDLKLINGVGPKLEEKLNSIGVYRFEQIANWTEENIAQFDELLSSKGRIESDEWVVKAAALHTEKYSQ